MSPSPFYLISLLSTYSQLSPFSPTIPFSLSLTLLISFIALHVSNLCFYPFPFFNKYVKFQFTTPSLSPTLFLPLPLSLTFSGLSLSLSLSLSLFLYLLSLSVCLSLSLSFSFNARITKRKTTWLHIQQKCLFITNILKNS